ncbi:hypothetical protein JHK82_051030 [Glycine max]|uniref:Uncharacterized protein n=2 Tax=Glycine subgen. Soja TaxID=1462606 RepID=A0A0R0FBZ4_SOYBN|nr:hypothetical protein JHK86_050885 [Glycine max]KAG4925193.1 hypothetical protein JHK87_050733 [Glycine soja]KAG4936812.1 hypothetical protein JHK85_051731 [Glycine max]KAG5092252.1 hypothetical protein JHK82_051030 [Glycine max]KAG5095331.1 hypothetical protein JHK84_050919 [Glycine max]
MLHCWARIFINFYLKYVIVNINLYCFYVFTLYCVYLGNVIAFDFQKMQALSTQFQHPCMYLDQSRLIQQIAPSNSHKWCSSS